MTGERHQTLCQCHHIYYYVEIARARASKRSLTSMSPWLHAHCFRPTERRTYRLAEPPGRVNKLRQHDLSFSSLPFLIASMSFSALQLQSYTSHLKSYDLVLMAYLVILGMLCLKLRPVSAVSCKFGRLSNSLFLLSCTVLAPSTVIHTLPLRMNR